MRRLTNILMFVAVTITWMMLIYLLTLGNLLLLVPWDTAIVRPDLGTWQRSLNDFFEGRLGETFAFIVISVITMLPIVKTLGRRWNANLRVIVANLLFVFLGYFLLLGSFLLRNALFPSNSDGLDSFHYNYAQSIIPLITIWLCYLIWLREIMSLGNSTIKAKNKSKNADHHHAVKRLTDANSNELSTDYQDTLASSQHLGSQ